LRGIVRTLSGELARPLDEPAERFSADGALGGVLGASDRERPDTRLLDLDPEDFGELGSISAEVPQDWFGKRTVALRARSALVVLGPAVTGFLVEVPPVPEAAHARALSQVIGAIYVRERKRALDASAEAREAFQGRYRGLADLCVPVISTGLRDPDGQVRRAFQQVRDEVLEGALDGLDADDPRVRGAAEATLTRLGSLAAQPLERIAAGKVAERSSAQSRAAAERIARRIRFGISAELARRLGHDLEGYDALEFRARRQMVFELERLGGKEAIPTLRALLKEERSDSVRTMAAISLFRLGDPAGSQWLALNGAGLPLPQISKRDLAAIYMDQGLRYLTLGRFERAEREFKQVLEVEPQNDVAWYNLACTYARWGKVDEALDHLEQAIRFGFDDVSHMEQDPDLDNLRAHPRYRAMIEGLEPADDEDDEAGDEPVEELEEPEAPAEEEGR
jgi:tetratricopeptide (TPR) repeat protein